MTPPAKSLLLAIAGPEPTAQDRRLLALAAVMGISARTISVKAGGVLSQQLVGQNSPGPLCVAMSADVLVAINGAPASGADLENLLDGRIAELLVFACTNTVEHQRALLPFAGEAIAGITALDDQPKRFSLPSKAAQVSGLLAGLGFSGSYEEPAFAFTMRHGNEDACAILTADESPVFVQFKRKAASVFLIAGALPDIHKPLHRKRGVEHYYGPLLPPLIFLRHCFHEDSWQAPPSTARLIIDDPDLSMRYGFLDYPTLERSMQRHHYGTSIAFIPWNCWRTKPRNATRLLNADSNLSICIHGCDHTDREFEAQDPTLLDTLAHLAMDRMETQQKRTGAEFERVMVFPQGRFSTAAIQALRNNRYIAAVNTTVFPMDHGPTDITIGDLLLPAVTRYNGFPIFMRHYSRNLIDVALDLFLGKPALLVEHHQFFRNGCEPLEAVVSELYKLDPGMTWPSLTEQLTRSCLQRGLPNGSTEVLFFTRSFVFESREDRSCRFLFRKPEPDPELIHSVTVDGVPISHSFKEGFLELELDLDAVEGQTWHIEVIDKDHVHQKTSSLGIAYNARVMLRRGLSEFRDYSLARNDKLMTAAKNIANSLKVK